MKKIIVSFLFVLLFSGCSLFSDKKVSVKNNNSEPKAITVSITKDGFSQKNVKISINDKIVFFNEDDKTHQISVGSEGGIPLEKGVSYTMSFQNTGTFEMKDVLNPEIKGEIVVVSE